jgi:hypothetical protein
MCLLAETSAQRNRIEKKLLFTHKKEKKTRVVAVQARRLEPMTGIVDGMIPTNNPGILLGTSTPNRLCFR